MGTKAGVGIGTWLGLLGMAGMAWGAHPFAAEDAGTVGGGVAEVELATSVDGAGPELGCVGVSMVVHVGLTEHLDLGAALALDATPRPEGGWGSAMAAPVVDAKVRLRDPDGAAPGIATKLAWRPAVDELDGAGGHELMGVVAATWLVGASAVGANAGVVSEDAGPTTFQVAAGASTELNDLVHVGVDAVLSLALGEQAGLDLMAGALFHVSSDRVISLGVGAGWHDGDVAWVATAGVTAAFGGD